MVEFLNFYHLKYNNFIRVDIDLLEAVVFFLLTEPSRNRRYHLMQVATASPWGEVVSRSAAVHPAAFYTYSMVFTGSLGSLSLSKVLWNVTSLTILSSAITRKSLMVLRAVPASLYAFFKLHFSSGGSTAPPRNGDGLRRGCCGQPSQHLYGLQVIILQDSALLVAAATRPLSAHLFPSAPLCWCDTLLTLPDQVCHLLGVFLG